MLLHVFLVFATLSLVAVGGATAILPEMHRQLVVVNGWMDDATFTQLFALAQAAPGPNILAVSMFGWHIAGPAGLAVATLGMLLPAGALAWVMGGLTQRLAGAAWLKPAQFGLVPIAVGLIAASGVIMADAAGGSALTYAIIGASTLVVWRTRYSPLWVLAAGGILGAIFLR
ncbi:MAG: chromate transporter [Rubritepida sp.]|jgi:chromate transporter|nr:chromate transporter [Rubritepida sp.]